jgi:hypothetical protein
MIDVSQASLVLLGLSVVIGGALLVAGLGFGLFVGREYPPEVKEEEPVEDPTVRAKRTAAYRLGALILLGLAVLTLLEFGVAVTWASAVILLLIALFKAGLIVNYFMHVSRLWSEEGH